MYNAPLIHPVINFPAAGGIRTRAPSSIDPIQYPRRIRYRKRGLSGAGELEVDQARESASWIQRQIRRFRDLEGRLSLEFHQAAQLEGRARAAGNLEAAAAAARLRESSFELLLDYDQVRGQVEDLVARIPGLGAIPLAVLIAAGAAIIAVAGAMAAIFRRVTAQERAIDLVARGVLTPEEVQKMNLERSGTLFSGLGMTGGIGTLLALAVAITVGLPILADSLGRR